MSLQAQKSARVAYADLVRVVAILMVVLVHSASPIFNTVQITTGDFAVSVILDCIAHAAVPLFVMVSGVFLLDEQRDMSVRRAIGHYALPLVGLFFFWSALYAVANKVAIPVLFENAAINGDMAKAFGVAVLEGAYHMWYLPMMAGLYLIAPILRTFVKQDSRHLVRWFLLIVFVLRFVLPTGIRLIAPLTDLDFSAAYNSFELLAGWEYPAYYVAGWYIAHTRPEKSVRRKIYVAGALALAAMMLLTYLVSVYWRGEAVKELMEQKSVFCCVYAVALFSLMAWEGQNLRSNTLLTRLSALSFGVYIVHVEIQQLYKLFIPYNGNALVYILVQWLAVTAISFAATWVLSKIPLLKRSVRA